MEQAPTPARQWLKVKWRPDDKKEYTYHTDLDIQLAAGDIIRIPSPKGEGWMKVTVTETNVEKPRHYDTKAILGRYIEGAPYAD